MNVLEKFKLNNLVAVVTGAGKGIGRGIAISLAEAGADIVVASRNKKDLEETSIAISSVGKKCLVVPTDVTKKGELENLALKTKNEFGKIDIWVNNAGGLPDATPRYMSKTSEDEFDAQINLNLKAVWSGCVIASNYMQETGGSIINISSATSKNMKPNIKNGIKVGYVTQLDRVIKIIWGVFGFAWIFIVAISLIYKVSPVQDVLFLLSIVLIMTGLIIKFNNVTIGGIGLLIFTAYSYYNPVMNLLLVNVIGLSLGMLVPGLSLYFQKNNE